MYEKTNGFRVLFGDNISLSGRGSILKWLAVVALATISTSALLSQLVFLDSFILQIDLKTHLRWAHQFHEGMKDGMWYPRWAYASHYGLGDPTFLYYQPLFYYAVSAINFVVGEIDASVQAVLLVINVALGLVVFAILNRGSGVLGSILGMLFVQTVPVVFFLQSHHGAFPWVFSLPFLVLFANESIKKNPNPLFVALWLSLTVLSHLLSAFMGLIVIFIFKFFEVLFDKLILKTSFVPWAFGSLVGLLLSSFYLYPAITLLGLVSPEGWVDDPSLDWRGAFAFPLVSLLTQEMRWFAMQYPFPVLSLLFIIFGAIATTRLAVTQNVLHARRLLVAGGVALLLSTELAYPLYATLPFMEMLQWPYRFVVPATLLSALGMSMALCERPGARLPVGVMCGVVCTVTLSVILLGYVQNSVVREGEAMPSVSDVMQGEFGQPEYRVGGRGEEWRAYVQDGGWLAECERKGAVCREEVEGSHSWASTVITGHPVKLRVPRFSFAGWSGTANGEAVAVYGDPQSGLGTIDLSEGTHRVELQWTGLPEESIGRGLSALGFVLVLGIWLGKHLRGSKK